MGYLGLLEAILGNLGAGRRENAIGVARIGAETLKIATVSRFLWFLAPPGSPHKTGPGWRETPPSLQTGRPFCKKRAFRVGVVQNSENPISAPGLGDSTP